jgi:hypothetical protein
MTYFKYLKSDFADSFLQKGSLRVGTLFDYRNTEKYNFAVSDRAEGTSNIVANNETINGSGYKGTIPGIKVGAGAKIEIGEGASIKVQISSDNYYIFCVSKSFSKNMT